MLLYVYLRYAFNNGSEEAEPGALRPARLNDALEFVADPYENELPPLQEVYEGELVAGDYVEPEEDQRGRY